METAISYLVHGVLANGRRYENRHFTRSAADSEAAKLNRQGGKVKVTEQWLDVRFDARAIWFDPEDCCLVSGSVFPL